MLAGPSVANCFNSEDGMGICLRGKMVEAGILPGQAVAVAQPAVAPTPAVPAVIAPEVAVVEPQPEVAPPAETAAVSETPAPVPDTLIAATFGLLRAEPDGSVVIAGSGTPGSEIEVYSGDELLGKAKVEASGDWVLVPDAPIPPGGTELTLAEAGKQGRAAESFVVVVNDDKTSEPLVVASTPGQASAVLQGLERPSADKATEVAAVATPEPTPTPDAATPAASAASGVAAAVAATVPAAAAEQAAAATVAAVEPTPAPETAAAAPVAETPVAGAAPVAATPAEAPAKPEIAVAAVDPVVPAQPAPAATLAAIPPTIDAIEIEGEKTFFAGGGSSGSIVRLYIDGKYIADATVTDGRWLVEAGKVLTQPSQRIRVDMLKPGTAEVSARAEVDFKVEIPANKPTAVAAADAAKPVVADEPAPATAAPAEPAAATSPAEAVAAVAKPAEQPAAPLADATKPEAVTPPAPAESAPVTEPAPAVETAETAPAATDAETDVPTMVAVAVGDPEMARFASGKAIIRRGDNLWTIARRVYGAGIKYTTIYEANNGQIRNPDRIYPGQVFDLPESAN